MKKVNLFYQCHFIVVSDISRNNIYLKNKIKLYLKTENLTTGWYSGEYDFSNFTLVGTVVGIKYKSNHLFIHWSCS